MNIHELLKALKGIEAICDNQNPSHEDIWRIAHGAIQSAEPEITNTPALPEKFTYFLNHGDEEGRGCYTVCYGDYNESDEIIVGCHDTEEDAIEACKRLNEILESKIVQPTLALEWKERFRDELPPCRNMMGTDITEFYIEWVERNIITPLTVSPALPVQKEEEGRPLSKEDSINPSLDWKELIEKFFKECVEKRHWEHNGAGGNYLKINMAPHDLFEWFKAALTSNTALEGEGKGLAWVRHDPPKDIRETYVCMVIKKENGCTSIKPEYVEWWFNKWSFPIGHEEGWKVLKYLEEKGVSALEVGKEDSDVTSDKTASDSVASHTCADGNSIEQKAACAYKYPHLYTGSICNRCNEAWPMKENCNHN